MSYTMAQANDLLANINSEADLRSLISQLDVASGAQPGATTLLYSGWTGDAVHSGAAAIVDPDFQTVNQEEQVNMAFINERIPESEKEKFTFPVSTRPDGSKPTLWKWTIDYERNVFLVFTDAEGGAYEGTQLTKYFVLSWKGELIYIAADPLPATYLEKGAVMSWRVHRLDIPPPLQNQKEEVLQLVRDAFVAMGELYDGDQFAVVTVEFNLPSSH